MIGADRLSELETVHVGHLNVGEHHIERLPGTQHRKPLLRVGRNLHLVAAAFSTGAKHVAEERAVVDQQHGLRQG